MNAPVIHELLNKIDAVNINTYSKLKSSLGKDLQKKTRIPLPLKTILNNTLELIYIILIIASILGMYFVSGVHEWWVKLVGHIT